MQSPLALFQGCHGKYIYVLLLQGGHIFVGSTDHLMTELESHFMGHSRQEWLQEYPIHGILEVRHSSAVTAQGLLFQTTELVLQYMRRFGIENVRGGELSDYQLSTITNRLISVEFGQRYVTVRQLLQQTKLVQSGSHSEWVIYVLALDQQQYFLALSQNANYLAEIKALFAAPFNYAFLSGHRPLHVAEQIVTRTSDTQVANQQFHATYQRLAAKVGAKNILANQAVAL